MEELYNLNKFLNNINFIIQEKSKYNIILNNKGIERIRLFIKGFEDFETINLSSIEIEAIRKYLMEKNGETNIYINLQKKENNDLYNLDNYVLDYLFSYYCKDNKYENSLDCNISIDRNLKQSLRYRILEGFEILYIRIVRDIVHCEDIKKLINNSNFTINNALFEKRKDLDKYKKELKRLECYKNSAREEFNNLKEKAENLEELIQTEENNYWVLYECSKKEVIDKLKESGNNIFYQKNLEKYEVKTEIDSLGYLDVELDIGF